MKIILILILSTLAAFSQTSTNLAFKVTAEVVTAGVTNSNNTTLNLTYATAKDKLRIDGLSYAYFQARQTNGPGALSFTNSFDNFLAKQWSKSNADAWANENLRVNAEDTIRRLRQLLTVDFDLLSAQNKADIAAIAGLVP